MKQLNNRTLLFVLIGLAVLLVLTRVFRSPAREKNIETGVLQVDTTLLKKIVLAPATENRKQLTLALNNKQWKVSRDNKEASADHYKIRRMLSQLASMKVDRIVSRKRDKWDEYEVSDSTGTDVIVNTGGKDVTIKIGKSSGNSTYVRKLDDDAVYAVSNFQAYHFNQKFNDWRVDTFVEQKKENVTRIAFNYPDSGFVLTKKDNVWMLGDAKADSAKVESYLNKLSFQRMDTFVDDFTPPGKPDVSINVDSDHPVILQGWKDPSGHWMLSGIQKDVYFKDENKRVFDALFVGRKTLSALK